MWFLQQQGLINYLWWEDKNCKRLYCSGNISGLTYHELNRRYPQHFSFGLATPDYDIQDNLAIEAAAILTLTFFKFGFQCSVFKALSFQMFSGINMF